MHNCSTGRWSCKHFLHFYSMKGKHHFFLQPENRQLARGFRLHVLDDAPPILPILKICLVVAQAHIVDAEKKCWVNFQGMDSVGLLHESQLLPAARLSLAIEHIAVELDLTIMVFGHFATSAAMSCAAAYSAGVSALTCAKRRRPRRPLAGRATSASGKPRMGSQTSLVSDFGPESRIIVHASIGHNFPQWVKRLSQPRHVQHMRGVLRPRLLQFGGQRQHRRGQVRHVESGGGDEGAVCLTWFRRIRVYAIRTNSNVILPAHYKVFLNVIMAVFE